jgi:hypothetical protein
MEPVPRIPPLDRPATYDDLMKVPDIMVAEIVDGELHASPRPALRHANVTSSLGVFIGGPFHHGRGGPGGWWILEDTALAHCAVPTARWPKWIAGQLAHGSG